MLFTDEIIISDRYSIIVEVDLNRSYDAFVYMVEVLVPGTSTIKYYIGWHCGQIEDIHTLKYFHSSTNPELKKDLENSSKIINRILHIGTKEEMATMETRMLKQVNAVKNPQYYNKSNGGGKYSKDLAINLQRINKIIDDSKNGIYPKIFYNKDKLKRLLENEKYIQVRENLRDDEYIQELRLLFNGQTADFIDPIVMLMEKNPDEDGCIISGNQRTRAVVSLGTVNGLYAIEIPYEAWCDLSATEVRALGFDYNKRIGKTQKYSTYDDYANFVVNSIIENNLYTADGKPMFNHPSFSALFESYGLNPSQKGEVTKRAKRFYAQRVNIGHNNNFVCFSDQNVKNEPVIKKYYESHVDFIKNHQDVAKIIKVTAGNSILSQIEKHLFVTDAKGRAIDFHKNIAIIVYHPKPGHKESEEWAAYKSKWEMTRDKILAPQGIHIYETVLPTDTSALKKFQNS
jgi:hypothetical protein